MDHDELSGGRLLFKAMNFPFLLPPGTNGASEQRVKWTEDPLVLELWGWGVENRLNVKNIPFTVESVLLRDHGSENKDFFLGIVSKCDTCWSFKMDTTNIENESFCR